MANRIKNIGASVRACLLSFSKAKNQSFDLVLTRFAIERPGLKLDAERYILGIVEIERPTTRMLGLSQTLNPFQEGGPWNWMRIERRYQQRLQARKQARREFDLRFARTASDSR